MTHKFDFNKIDQPAILRPPLGGKPCAITYLGKDGIFAKLRAEEEFIANWGTFLPIGTIFLIPWEYRGHITLPKTPVNSIQIPDRFVEVSKGWHCNMQDMLYAVSSTGNLTTGINRPYRCDTDRQWYLTIWRNLSADVHNALKVANNEECYPVGHANADILAEFSEYVDSIVERLEVEYDLGEWDPMD